MPASQLRTLIASTGLLITVTSVAGPTLTSLPPALAAEVQTLAAVPASADPLSEAKKALDAGKAVDAENKFREALSRVSSNFKTHMDCLNGLAKALENQSKFSQAEAVRKQALALAQSAKGPASCEYAECLDLLASNYYDTNHFDECIPLYQKALAIREKGPDQVALSTAINNLALAYTKDNRDSDAEPLFKRALAIDEKAIGAGSEDVAIDLNNLAALECRAGRTGDAREHTERALAIQKQLHIDTGVQAAPTYMNLGRIQIAERNIGLAEEPFRKALELREHAAGVNHPSVARVLEEYAQLLEQLDRKPEATKMKERIYAIKLANSTPAAAAAAGSGGSARAGSAAEATLDKAIKEAQDAIYALKKDESLALWKQAAAEAQKVGDSSPKLSFCLGKLAQCYNWSGQKADALATFKRAIELREKTFGPSDPGLAVLYEDIAPLYMTEQNYAQAQTYLQKAVDIKTNAQLPERMLIHPLQSLSSCMSLTSSPGVEPTCKRLIAILEAQPDGRKNPAYMGAVATLGGALMKRGRLEEGMRVMQQVSSMSRASTEELTANAKKDYTEYTKLQDELMLKTGSK